MDLIETTVKFIRAIEATDWFTVESLLSDDFHFHGPFPDPIDKPTWLSFQQAISQAIPDLAFHPDKLRRENHDVYFTTRITGTHTKKLTLPIPGVHSLPPTMTTIQLPVQHLHAKYKDGYLFELHASNRMHTGILGLLEQLGFEP